MLKSNVMPSDTSVFGKLGISFEDIVNNAAACTKAGKMGTDPDFVAFMEQQGSALFQQTGLDLPDCLFSIPAFIP